jgi:hypothetical protein
MPTLFDLFLHQGTGGATDLFENCTRTLSPDSLLWFSFPVARSRQSEESIRLTMPLNDSLSGSTLPLVHLDRPHYLVQPEICISEASQTLHLTYLVTNLLLLAP